MLKQLVIISIVCFFIITSLEGWAAPFTEETDLSNYYSNRSENFPHNFHSILTDKILSFQKNEVINDKNCRSSTAFNVPSFAYLSFLIEEKFLVR